jgi:hypothetical protein
VGYFTHYSLSQIRQPISEAELAELIASDENASAAILPDGDSLNAAKWYEHENCLCAWSMRHPTTIFCLHAEGEDTDGIWDKYFMGGAVIHTEMYRGLPKVDLESLLS